VTTAYLARALENGDPVAILDSREAWEWGNGHIPGAILMPVAEIPARAGSLPQDAPVAVHCEHGYRSAVASSLLERAGIERILHVTDGFEQWRRAWNDDSVSRSEA
jgi:rhodanese-related sulfurtransferase